MPTTNEMDAYGPSLPAQNSSPPLISRPTSSSAVSQKNLSDSMTSEKCLIMDVRDSCRDDTDPSDPLIPRMKSPMQVHALHHGVFRLPPNPSSTTSASDHPRSSRHDENPQELRFTLVWILRLVIGILALTAALISVTSNRANGVEVATFVFDFLVVGWNLVCVIAPQTPRMHKHGRYRLPYVYLTIGKFKLLCCGGKDDDEEEEDEEEDGPLAADDYAVMHRPKKQRHILLIIRTIIDLVLVTHLLILTITMSNRNSHVRWGWQNHWKAFEGLNIAIIVLYFIAIVMCCIARLRSAGFGLTISLRCLTGGRKQRSARYRIKLQHDAPGRGDTESCTSPLMETP